MIGIRGRQRFAPDFRYGSWPSNGYSVDLRRGKSGIGRQSIAFVGAIDRSLTCERSAESILASGVNLRKIIPRREFTITSGGICERLIEIDFDDRLCGRGYCISTSHAG
jgi:hypothetical protein